MVSERGLTREILRDLSDGVSACYRSSNRAWLALITVSVVVLLPRAPGDDVELPFGLGTVAATSFSSVAIIILVAVTLGFAAAHAQAFRANTLAQRLLRTASADDRLEGVSIHPRDYFDLVVAPTINRVGPLAQLLRGDSQLLPASARAKPIRQVVVTTYYVALKVIASFFYYVLPGAALVHAGHQASLAGTRRMLAYLGLGIAGAALLQIVVHEIVHVFVVARSGVGVGGRDG